ncbi:MAG TPA: hypothetical protein VGE06_12895, partial [Flavisolibacter sp.]
QIFSFQQKMRNGKVHQRVGQEHVRHHVNQRLYSRNGQALEITYVQKARGKRIQGAVEKPPGDPEEGMPLQAVAELVGKYKRVTLHNTVRLKVRQALAAGSSRKAVVARKRRFVDKKSPALKKAGRLLLCLRIKTLLALPR